MKKLIVVGQAQASALASILERVAQITDRYEVVTASPDAVPTHDHDDLVLLETYEDDRNAHLELASERVIRFPRLRFGLLWPHWAENPFDRPEPPLFPHGRFPFGDSYVISCVRKDIAPGEILPFMHAATWPASWPPLNAAFETEADRLKRLDDKCDVKMAFYILKHFRTERLFHAPIAPAAILLGELAARLSTTIVGEPSAPSRARALELDEVFGKFQVPIHPYVAHYFGLEWYAAITTYNHANQTLTFDEYFSALIAHSYAVKHDTRPDPTTTTLIVYGNCQAEAVASILTACELENVRVRYLRSFDEPGKETSTIDRRDVLACDVLWEQHDGLSPFPHREWLPPACSTVKFPAVDFNLLWPLTGANPFTRPELPKYPFGRFPYGDAVITEAVRLGLNADEAVAYFHEHVPQRLPDLDRFLAIETARLKARDAHCDVTMGAYVIDHFREKRLFWTVNHPTAELLATLVRALIACTTTIPELAKIDVEKALKNFGSAGPLGVTSTPILPQIASHYGLTWFNASKERYQHFGSSYSFDGYFRALAEDAVSNVAQYVGD